LLDWCVEEHLSEVALENWTTDGTVVRAPPSIAVAPYSGEFSFSVWKIPLIRNIHLIYNNMGPLPWLSFAFFYFC
jgi:hypothetical protein